ncbi:MAG: DUF3540 domain-containing protein [Nitrospinae bacterium]|nr:DUF3540 domain-containing protein [Nitrospinota bacterium]
MELIESVTRYGTVVRGGEPSLVKMDDGTVEARRAVSCLVAPEPGDRVLLVTGPDGDIFTLAVLERPGGRPLTIPLGAEATLSGGAITLKGEKLSLEGKEGEGTFGTFALAVSRLSLVCGVVDAIVKGVNMVADRLVQRSRESLTTVEGHHQVEAGSVTLKAEGILDLSGADAQLTATEVARIDGEQIHIG